jgi:hypothetical protein
MISFNQLFKVTKKDDNIVHQVQQVQQEQSTNTLIKNEINMEFQEELFKKGDFVKIIYKENSKLNMYKTYNGEIRTYYKGGITASIQLEACNSAQAIIFPIDHFIKRNFNDPKEKSIGIIKEYFVDGEKHITIHY